MRIGIVGGGVVGRATARAFMEHVDEIRVYDIVKERGTHSLHDTLRTDIIFVCLPTPQSRDSLACDTSALDNFFESMMPGPLGVEGGLEYFADRNFVLRSTVPIGYTRDTRQKYRLRNLVHSPEFLTSRCAMTDAQLPARNIIGSQYGISGQGVLDSSNESIEFVRKYGGPCTYELANLYRNRFPGVLLMLVPSNTSEMIKLALNSFFSTKVAFFNEIYSLCKRLGIDFEAVRAGMLSDGRIAHAHTKVPGPDGSLGFGGSCLPKDLANLITCMRDANTDHVVCASALTYRNDK